MTITLRASLPLLALFAGAAIPALCGLAMADPVADCTAGSATATADMPLELAAILEPACARAWLEAEPDLASGRAVVTGYPSLLLAHADLAEAVDLLSQVVAQGDRGFFEHDPAILPLLSEAQTEALSPADRVFIAAVHDPDLAIARATEPADALQVLPIWDNPANAQRLIAACASADCTSTTACAPPEGPRLGLAEKLRIARGELQPQAAFALCDLSADWIVGLRRAGIVDTRCTSSLQINAVLGGILDLGAACMSPGRGLFDYPVLSDADAVRYIRFMAASGRLAELDEGSIQYIGAYFPQAAEYLSALGQME